MRDKKRNKGGVKRDYETCLILTSSFSIWYSNDNPTASLNSMPQGVCPCVYVTCYMSH